MENISQYPEIRYFMKPEEQLKVFKEIRQLKIDMVGIYHSHSSTPAYPSAHDIEMAFYPEASYVIISLQDFNNPEVRAYKITEGNIEEEKIVVRKNILFICIENSCISQIAEAIANNLYWRKFVAYSAGSNPSGIVNPKAVEVMKEIGIDISEQKSKSIEQVKNIEFDYIINLGCGDVCQNFVQSSTFNLQRLVWDIPDPKGKPIEFFRQVRNEIEQKISKLANELSE